MVSFEVWEILNWRPAAEYQRLKKGMDRHQHTTQTYDMEHQNNVGLPITKSVWNWIRVGLSSLALHKQALEKCPWIGDHIWTSPSMVYLQRKHFKALPHQCFLKVVHQRQKSSKNQDKSRLLQLAHICFQNFNVKNVAEGTKPLSRQHCRLNIFRYIGWIDKYSICQINQNIYTYWDGSAVYNCIEHFKPIECFNSHNDLFSTFNFTTPQSYQQCMQQHDFWIRSWIVTQDI